MAAKAMAQAALGAVTQGKLGYAIICGTKRFQMPMNEKMNWEKSSERLVALFDLTNWRRRRPA